MDWRAQNREQRGPLVVVSHLNKDLKAFQSTNALLHIYYAPGFMPEAKDTEEEFQLNFVCSRNV